MARPAGFISPELAVPRETLRHAPSRAAPGTAPRGEVGLGAGAAFALAPGEAVGEAKHFGVGQPTHAIALQNHAAAAGDLGYFGEIDNQHPPVLADKGSGVAVDRRADAGLFPL